MLSHISNTLSITSIFLLLNRTLPPNAYEFYALKSTFLFEMIPDWQTDISNKDYLQ
jgi:hypothetical protein